MCDIGDFVYIVQFSHALGVSPTWEVTSKSQKLKTFEIVYGFKILFTRKCCSPHSLLVHGVPIRLNIMLKLFIHCNGSLKA